MQGTGGQTLYTLARAVIGDPAGVAPESQAYGEEFSFERTQQGRRLCLSGVPWWHVWPDEPAFWVHPEVAVPLEATEGAARLAALPQDWGLLRVLREVLEAEEVSGMVLCPEGCGWVAPWDGETWAWDAEEACPHVVRCGACRGLKLGTVDECECEGLALLTEDPGPDAGREPGAVGQEAFQL